MTNEEEVIVDPNNEQENVETQETPPENQQQKPVESPEDRASRLLRQTNQARKKLGLSPVGEVKPEINNNDPLIQDELKLIARGLSDEEIEQAKVIAKGKGVSLQEAVKEPLFVIFQEDLKEKQKRESAKLGASKGSSETQEEVTGVESGSTREDHQKAFKKLVGKK